MGDDRVEIGVSGLPAERLAQGHDRGDPVRLEGAVRVRLLVDAAEVGKNNRRTRSSDKNPFRRLW